MVEENEDLAIKEIATDIVNDIILEFCFEVHRAIKLGYYESYFASEKKYDQESKSLKDSFQERQLFYFNKTRMIQEYPFSSKQGAVYPKKMNGLENISNGVETGVSMKDLNVGNSSPLNSKESRERSDCFLQYEKAKNMKRKLFALKPKTLNNNDRILNFSDSARQNSRENQIVLEVMKGFVFQKKDSISNSDVLMSSDEHFKLSTKEIKQDSSLVHHTESCSPNHTEGSKFQSYSQLLQMENEWIQEAFHCLGCKNSKSFQDWMHFIAFSQTEDDKTMNSEKEEDGDIFGNPEKALKNAIHRKTCTCTVCKRKIGAVRFAYHLGTCMGLGRHRSPRIYSITK